MYRSITYLTAKMTEELAAALISSIIFSCLVFFPLKLAGSFGLFFCAYYLTTIIGIGAHTRSWSSTHLRLHVCVLLHSDSVACANCAAQPLLKA